jgi:hypothetical protein
MLKACTFHPRKTEGFGSQWKCLVVALNLMASWGSCGPCCGKDKGKETKGGRKEGKDKEIAK